MEKRDFRILVADDDEIARDVIRVFLSREGYSVICAQDGLEAIRLLRIEDIHLVITDLRMPGADGIEVLKCAMRGNPDIAVILLTAYGTLDIALEAIKEGAYSYITKPFRGQEIVLAAKRVHSRACLLSENRELRKLLRETFRDLEILRNVPPDEKRAVPGAWLARIEQMKKMDVLTNWESEVLKEHLSGRGK